MNKADFDRRYKALKGHMLSEVVAISTNSKTHAIIDIYWSSALNKIVIVYDE